MVDYAPMEPNATPAAPPQAAPQSQGPQDPQLTKAVDQVLKDLAVLYKTCHKLEPDSPACDAIMQIQKAVAEIDRMLGGDGQAGPVQQSGGNPFDQAGKATAQRMAAGAQARADAQAQMAGM